MHLKWHPRILWEKKADEWFYYSLKRHPDIAVRKPETLSLEKNNGDKLLCTLLAVMCGAKVTDDTAAYADNLITKNTFTNWRYTTGKDSNLVTRGLSATFAKLSAPALTCVNIHTIIWYRAELDEQ